MKVSLMKVTQRLTSQLGWCNNSLYAKGELGGDEDVKWRDNDDIDLVDSDGKTH